MSCVGQERVPEAASKAVRPEEKSFVTADHRALFVQSAEDRCDACGAELHEPEDDQAPLGMGMYLWSRGDVVRVDPAPLGPSCAAAIGLTVLARWESEEEEG
jgi:hypothetical protein